MSVEKAKEFDRIHKYYGDRIKKIRLENEKLNELIELMRDDAIKQKIGFSINTFLKLQEHVNKKTL